MGAYYNEFDPGAAAWLRELIRRGLIANGVVDERDIRDVEPADLRGFAQCHFFAGIGGWSRALRLAGWCDDRLVWTGSPPCQPFSVAGAGLGVRDDRHLAPHWVELVRACRPPVLFGEQVASAAVFGKAAKRAGSEPDGAPEWAWLDDLFGRLEAARYACGASDLPAACIGAPHLRQRTFFGAVRLADADGGKPRETGCLQPGGEHGLQPEGCGVGGMADSIEPGLEGHAGHGHNGHEPGRVDAYTAGPVAASGGSGGMGWAVRLADAECGPAERYGHEVGGASGCHQGRAQEWKRIRDDAGHGKHAGGLVDAISERRRLGKPRREDATDASITSEAGGDRIWAAAAHAPDSPWGTADWLYSRDGKWRPVEPGTFPLAYGLSARVGRLRGYGNAIVPQAAAEFIRAFDEVTR